MTLKQALLATVPGLVTHRKLVLYMSPVAYLGKPVTSKAYGTFYICPGPVF